MRKLVLHAADARWAAMAERLEELMSSGDFRPLKDEGRTRAGLLRGPDGVPVFVKCVRAGSWLSGIVDTVRGSRGARWLRGARILGAAGFNRPAPLAALEVRRAGAVGECYLVCEALGEATVLSRAVFRTASDYRRRRSLLRAVAREVHRLHDAGLYTHDLQETNLMVEQRDDAPAKISFVDLEDFRRARSVSRRWRLINLIHLDRSIGRFLSRSARLRFLYDYLGDSCRDRIVRRRAVAKLLRLRGRVENRRRGRIRNARLPITAAGNTTSTSGR